MNEKTAKRLLANVHYSQGRNRVSNRPVKDITLTVSLLKKKFKEQNGKCYWSNLPLNEDYNYIKHHPFAISVERLDNNKGYEYDNVVLTRRLFNLGRMAYPENEFREAINLLTQEMKA